MTTKPNKEMEVWFRMSGWGVPRKVGVAQIGADMPTTMHHLAELLRKLADMLDKVVD